MLLHPTASQLNSFAVMDADGVITVSTADEFVNALGSDRTIKLKPGVYDFTPYNDIYADGLMLSNIDNLTIIGETINELTVEFINADRFHDILNFQNCAGINIQNIKAGHTPQEYECDAQVFDLRDCEDIVIENCYLYGCGSEGVTARGCYGIEVKNTIITDCSLRAAYFSQTDNIYFENVIMSENRGLDVMILNGCRDAVFSNCIISDNKNIKWSLIEVAGCEDVTIENAVISGNLIADNTHLQDLCMFLCNGSNLVIENAIITGNTFPYQDHGNPEYINCLVYENNFDPGLLSFE